MGRKRRVRGDVKAAFAVLACALIVVLCVLAFRHRSGGAAGPSASGSSSSQAIPSSSGSSASSASQTPQALSAQEKTGGLLMLVNKAHLLPSGYTPAFATVPARYYSSSDKDRRFDQRAAPELERFIDAARAAGFDVNVISGYRTYAYQKQNYDRHVSALEAQGETSSQAEAGAAKLVAPPGTSEHQTGLAADIITSDWYTQHKDLTADFDKTAAFAWMVNHCADYGFVLRYPKGGESITGYDYEPWHYRYVGAENARAIMAKNDTLEQYVGQAR